MEEQLTNAIGGRLIRQRCSGGETRREKDQSDPALEGSREDVREGINRTGSEEGVLGLSTKSDIGCEIENSVSDVTVTELEPLKKKKGEDGKAGSGCV